MLYNEFLEGTGAVDNEASYKEYKRVETIYMESDHCTKQDAYRMAQVETVEQHEKRLEEETGIVRRIDDLGRVVIPKEIRRGLHLREGDPLEILVGDGGIFFVKYDIYDAPLKELKKTIRVIDEDLDLDADLRGQVVQKLHEAMDMLKKEEDE